MNNIVPVESKQVRIVWNKSNRKCYFVISDIVKALTKARDPDYTKKIKKYDKTLAKVWYQIVTPLNTQTNGGTQKMNCTNAKGLLRIIRSIRSPKAKPFKQWLAKEDLDRPKSIKNIASYTKRTEEFKKLLSNPDEWVEKQKRVVFFCEELYLQGKINDLELIFAMLGEDSFMDTFVPMNTKKIEQNSWTAKAVGKFAKSAGKQPKLKSGKKATTSINYFISPRDIGQLARLPMRQGT